MTGDFDARPPALPDPLFQTPREPTSLPDPAGEMLPTTPPAPEEAGAGNAAPFTIGSEDRYERLQMIPWWDQRRIAAARVLVVGAGALGNEVIKNLALLGVGTVVIADFDRIEHSNLSRSVLFRDRDCGQPKAEVAASAARDLNPQLLAVPLVGRIPDAIGLGLIQAMDAVIGCVDNREARLWINRLCWRGHRPWIDGGIQEISGVAKVFAPPGHPAHQPGRGCYECTMTENDYRLIQLRYSCPLLSREEILLGRVPTAPTISSIIAGLQVQEFLKLLHGLPSAAGTGLVFNGLANRFYQTVYPERDDCLSHESARPQFSTDLKAATTTPADLFHAAAAHADTRAEPAVCLDRDFVVDLVCDHCRQSSAVRRPAHQVGSASAACPECGQFRRPDMVHSIGLDSPLATLTLRELGIADWDLVRIRMAGGDSIWLSLDGDRPDWMSGPDGGGRRLPDGIA